LTVGTSSSTVSFFSCLRLRTRDGHRHRSSQPFVQPTRLPQFPSGHGLLLQPAIQIGSHSTSNSTFGCFFVPGSQTQIAARPHVAPQCMQAGVVSAFAVFLADGSWSPFAFPGAFWVLASIGSAVVFSLSFAPQARRTTERSRMVMIGLCMVGFSALRTSRQKS
jgi:hypothetical protein